MKLGFIGTGAITVAIATGLKSDVDAPDASLTGEWDAFGPLHSSARRAEL